MVGEIKSNNTKKFTGYYTESESITSDSSNMCWRIVNKEGDVFRRPQEGWGTNRVYIPVTAAKGNRSIAIF